MDGSDSENEGQLLIDESVDGRKRVRKPRGQTPKSKKGAGRRKAPLKLVVKSAKTSRKAKKVTESVKKEAEVPESPAQNVRTSNRVRKRTRKHSPSPVRSKKEPPKKKLKVKLKTVSKSSKKAKIAKVSNEKKLPQPEAAKQDPDSVDIESLSDDDISDVQYSSVIVEEDSSEKVKKRAKPKKKAGIKLKLSLGKVLSSQVSDATEAVPLKIDEPEKVADEPIKPLIISKRQVSLDSGDTDFDFTSTGTLDTSHDDIPHASILSSGNESPYYSSSSEDHRPLTLRLSVGKPLKRSLSEFKSSPERPKPAFPNIQRSWSITPAKTEDVPPLKFLKTQKSVPSESKNPPKSPPPALNLSTSPYLNPGLQSLLDVVSVEINEQNKNAATIIPSPVKLPEDTVNSNKISTEKNDPKTNVSKPDKLDKDDRTLSNHEGHLPSLTFPKPKLHFLTKKRPRSKSMVTLPVSPKRNPLSMLAPPEEVKGEESVSEQDLTEKERRRRDKKKVLNSDFVDPDSVISGVDPDDKKSLPKKKPVAQYIPKSKGGGFSLIMPQMLSQSGNIDKKFIPADCPVAEPQSKINNFIPKRPKKGLATAKQRLANKLKIRRTFAH